MGWEGMGRDVDLVDAYFAPSNLIAVENAIFTLRNLDNGRWGKGRE